MLRRHTSALLAQGMLILALGATASAATFTDFDIGTPIASTVFNDRIGNSRLFGNPNTDRLRVSVFATPSPDSDAFDMNVGGSVLRSTNGSLTTVSLTHPDFGTIPSPRNMAFVGLTSGGGGGRNEYTTTFNLNSSVVAGLLPLWDVTPFTVTVRNPRTPNGVNAVSFPAVDYDPRALPPFVTDLTLTGGGAHPRLDWKIPATDTPPTGVSIQIRRIDAESADHTRVTSSTLVDSRNFPAGTTSYTIDQPLSNAHLLGLPPDLQQNERYEISVQLDVVENGGLKGRSRTFFEFSPLPAGAGEVAVFLPSVGPDGVFKFDVQVQAGESIAIDPRVAIGYDYQIGPGDPLFHSVTLPSVGDGLYDLWLFDGANYVLQTELAAGLEYFFPGTGVDRFRVTGIEPSAGLDPSDTTAFVTTLTFANAGRFTGTMTPLSLATVPEPPILGLIAAGLAFLAGARRRGRRNG